MSQIFRSFEANSGDYLTKMIGKSDQKGFSAVGSLFSDSLLGEDAVLNYLSQAEIVHMSTIVMGELFAGFRGGNKYETNVNYLKQFLAKPTVMETSLSRETAEIFGEIKDNLKQSGTPLPINDIWIASQVMEQGAVLITYDRHFKKIPG